MAEASDDRVLAILSEAKLLAQEYRILTGKPLGITGDVAEYEAWSLDAFLPVDILYDAAVSWIILGLAVAGALVAAFLPPPAAPRDAVDLTPRRSPLR